jgi:hypothetical protein
MKERREGVKERDGRGNMQGWDDRRKERGEDGGEGREGKEGVVTQT